MRIELSLNVTLQPHAAPRSELVLGDGSDLERGAGEAVDPSP